MGATTCVLFLSLRYHRLHPEYIYHRIQTLGKRYTLRILLVLVDIENHSDALRELTKTSVVNNYTVILSWNSAEAGRYLETFKSYETTEPTLIQEKIATDYTSRLVDTLSGIRSVNRSDAFALVGNLGSLKRAINSDATELELIPGWGAQKVSRFLKATTQPFIVRQSSSSIKQRT